MKLRKTLCAAVVVVAAAVGALVGTEAQAVPRHCPITVGGHYGEYICSYSPTPITWPDGHEQWFVVGTDFQVYTTWQVPGGGWSTWQSLGGQAYSKISISGLGSNSHIEINTTGYDRNWWRRSWNASSGWGAWQLVQAAPACPVTVGGYTGWRICDYQPTRVTWPNGREQVFVVGTDFQVWSNYQYSAGSSWSGWYALGPTGGNAFSEIEVDGPTDTFIRIRVIAYPRSMIYRNWYQSSGWGAWTDCSWC